SEQGREVTRRSRSVSEKRWAQDIMARVSASGAARALLLVTRAEASCARARAQGERFAGFDPMPLHLPEGEVLCLEATSAGSGGTGATVRLYEAPLAGFHGEVALASLTRPALEMASSNQPEAVSNQAEAVQWKQESCDGMTAEECRARTTGDPDEEAAPGSSSGWPIDPEVQAELDEFLLNLPVPALPVFNREENGQTIRPDQPFP
ncbi:MAG: hypothetical protein SGJ21_15845, partial [Alphaproteobacteria bacterium]|nr:hypothetical protein [Alphaproteobacteria bacterium]MDZ4762536.1 hypothetical protein [Alphaproteobacteria bacterium]